MRHERGEEHRHDHGDGEHGHSYGHTHGAVDPSVAASERGIWAIKWSFVALAATALLQLAVVLLSGSVALLSDTIHNFGDAATAVPLGVAFALARLGASRRYTFGYGRVEDLAGAVVVLVILFSAVVAGYQAVDRLLYLANGVSIRSQHITSARRIARIEHYALKTHLTLAEVREVEVSTRQRGTVSPMIVGLGNVGHQTPGGEFAVTLDRRGGPISAFR